MRNSLYDYLYMKCWRISFTQLRKIVCHDSTKVIYYNRNAFETRLTYHDYRD